MEGNAGMYVQIIGTNFDQGKLQVFFNGIPAEIRASKSERIAVSVPAGATDGPITITSGKQTVTFPFDFKVTATAPLTNHTLTLDPGGRVSSILLNKAEFDQFNRPDNQAWDAVMTDIYTKFNDEFDFIFLVYNNKTYQSGMPAAFMTPVSNSIRGTGQGIFDNTALYGSAGKLKSIISIITFGDYVISNVGPHELMHTWGNWGLPTEDWDSQNQKGIPAVSHWGFSGCGGALGGFVQSTLRGNIYGEPNRYTFREPTTNAFSNYELYLAGFLPPSELEPFDVLTGITFLDIETIKASTRTTYDLAKIESLFGVRTPDYLSSQKNFRALVMVLTPIPLTTEEWETIDTDAITFFQTSDNGHESVNFWESTGGLGTIDVEGLHTSLK
jgi:hypothetical protein